MCEGGGKKVDVQEGLRYPTVHHLGKCFRLSSAAHHHFTLHVVNIICPSPSDATATSSQVKLGSSEDKRDPTKD